MSISDFAEDKPTEQVTEWKDPATTSTETPVAAPPSTDAPSASTTAPPTPSAQTNPDTIMQGILSKIAPIGQKANFKLMIYGDPGAMKSSFVATAANNLIVDLEDGLISAKNSPNGIAEGVMSYPWTGFDDFGNLVGAFMKDAEELKNFKVLSIDTFSELQKRALAEITEREWQKRPSSNRYVPETEHHQENNERMIRVIRALRDLNRDLIITSHAKTVEPKNKPAKTYADFSESLSNKIMAMMDVVGYMQKRVVDGKLVPVLLTQGDGTIHCKSRVGMPAEIINPTYEQVRKYWEESKNS